MGWRTVWPAGPMEAAATADGRYPESKPSDLVLWAAWTVEGLHYMAEMDAALPPQRPGHAPDTSSVDLAHARWATVDAVTAVDLCAAALGRMHCDYPDSRGREMDFGLARKNKTLLALHEPGKWIRGVAQDDDYARVFGMRDALVHRTAHRRIEVAMSSSLGSTGVGGGTQVRRARLHLTHPDDAVGVDELVPLCRDVALRHVSKFVAAVDRI